MTIEKRKSNTFRLKCLFFQKTQKGEKEYLQQRQAQENQAAWLKRWLRARKAAPGPAPGKPNPPILNITKKFIFLLRLKAPKLPNEADGIPVQIFGA